MLSFFVQETVELEEIKEIVDACGFPVRSNGFAKLDEIVFFYNSEKSGFCFNAHKFEEQDIPDCAYNTPFLVCVGKDWTLNGLAHVIRSYRNFFFRKMPVLNTTLTDREVIDICKNCIILPWGGFPSTREGEKKLAIWLKKVNQIFFPLNYEQSNAFKLTINQ